jgi:dethiobiotin synthetase
VEAARARGLEVLGVVISGYPANPSTAELTNPAEIARLTGLPLLGVLPHDLEIDTEGGRPGSVRRWATSSLDPLLGGSFAAGGFSGR